MSPWIVIFPGSVGRRWVDGQDRRPGGALQNLNSLLPAGSPTIQYATAINDNGQIVASPAVLLNPS